MKLKITLSQTPMLPPIRGSNRLLRSNESEKYSVIYNLTKDCSTTEKFIRLMTTQLGQVTTMCDYNFYSTIQIDTFIKMKKRMNWIIRELTARGDVPSPEEWLVLNEDILDVETAKLNALHLYFENVSNMREVQDAIDYCSQGGMFVHIEEINQLVHSMEKWEPPEDGFLECFGVGRLHSPEGEVLVENLTDEDYNNFTDAFKWGDLSLDYFRVGKDLEACVPSNDVELIKTKGLEQQVTVHTAFEMRFKEDLDSRSTENSTRGRKEFIKENNLDQYYDFSLPMFSPGRVVVGKIDLTGTNKENVLEEIVKCTGITNVELIDE
jgi:hypothetical protein